MINSSIQPKIAFVHDWLTTFGGAEQILAALLEVWPDAPVFTLVHDPEGPCGSFTAGKEIYTSFIQRLPGAKANHRRYLPLMPMAVEQFDLGNYDLVISINHAVAHGVLVQADQLHISYTCTPMRYAWHLYHQYLQQTGLESGLKGSLTKAILHYLRLWDLAAAQRPDHMVVISKWAAKNVWRAYRRKADVIYPPVDINGFQIRQEKENYYVTISRLVPYKKVDLIIEAFTGMPDKKLVVIGDGPELRRLKTTAGSNVIFTGFLSFEQLRDQLENARAFVYAAVEDFGIVLVEALACGTPVIAYKMGGVLEIVQEGKTGIFYEEQNLDSLIAAIQQFEGNKTTFNIELLKTNAAQFSKERFKREFYEYIQLCWLKFVEKED